MSSSSSHFHSSSARAPAPSSSSSLPIEANATLDPHPSWPGTLEAVYHLFEDARARAQHPRLAERVRAAVQLTEEVLDELGEERCSISFNGGKDCTVLVHILAAVMQRRHQRTQGQIQADPAAAASALSNITSDSSSSSSSSSSTSLLPPPIKAVYIACPQPFESVERFVRFSVRHYHLRLRTVHGGMKQGLKEYLSGGGQPFSYPPLPSPEETGAGARSQNGAYTDEEEKAHSGANVTAIFIGTRATDPNGPSLFSQSSISSAGSPASANGHAQSQSASPTPEQQQTEGLRAWTDKDWPRVERIHPILSWSYSDVWDFLRCPLFGYAPLVGGGQSGAAGANDSAENGSGGGIQRADGATERWSDEQLEQEGCARSTGVPYCLLYDLGYTSLGSTYNTFPNPELLVLDEGAGETKSKREEHPYVRAIASGQPSTGDEGRKARHLPAYELKDEDGSLERKGRVKAKQPAAS